MNNFTSMTVTEKKAAAYDLLGQIEYLQQTLRELNQSIAADMQAQVPSKAQGMQFENPVDNELVNEASA